MPMERSSSITISRAPGGISSVRATMYRRLSTLHLLRSVPVGRQPVQRTSRLVHHMVTQAGRKVTRCEIGRVAIPMRKITREQQHTIGRKHLEHRVKVLGSTRFFERLGGEVDVLEDNFTGQPIEPGDSLAQRMPVLV